MFILAKPRSFFHRAFTLCSVCLFLLWTDIFSQAVITKPAVARSIADFGAVANDGKDDTWAFIKAGRYFSNEWDLNGVPLPKGKSNIDYKRNSAKLNIPSGEYLVGKQISVPANGLHTTYGKIFGVPAASAPLHYPAGTAYKAGLDVMRLNNVDQLSISGIGTKPPVVKYNDGLVIGYFNSKGEPMWFPATAYDGRYVVSIGNFLSVNNCKNISVENISVNGNNTPTVEGGKTLYNGGWASDLIQSGASGAYFINTQNVSLKKFTAKYMTLDGLVFQDYYKDTVAFPRQPLSNLLVSDCVFDYNRRQGFSWVGGRKLRISNTTFNHTSATAKGIARGNPAAGVDIEPETDGNNLLLCVDATFTNCNFINNIGCALVNDVTALRSKNISFLGCTFHDVDGYSVWVKGRSFTFINCKIWGGFVYGNSGSVAGEETRFFDCDFADEELPGRKGVYWKGMALVESWQTSRRMLFDHCSFRTLHDGQRLLSLFVAGNEEKDFHVFADCSFSTSLGGGGNVLFGAMFSGNTSIVNRGKTNESILINGFVARGSNSAKQPATFSIEGKVLLHPANSHGPGFTQFVVGRSRSGNTNEGYLNFTIGKEACLYGYWSQELMIGKNATFTNHGQLALLSSNVSLSGKLVLSPGSYTAFFHAPEINNTNTQQGEFAYSQSSRFGISPAWKTNLAGLGAGVSFSQIKIPGAVRVKKDAR